MILGIICTVAIALVALWQTWSLHGARSVGAHLLVQLERRESQLHKQRALIANLTDTITKLHRAAQSGNGPQMLAVLAAATARIEEPKRDGAEP